MWKLKQPLFVPQNFSGKQVLIGASQVIRAGNSVYLGSGAASQKKAQELKTQEEGKKEEMGREKKKRRGVRGEEIGKKDQTNRRT